MSPLTELTGIAADAQKLAVTQAKEAAAFSAKAFEANLNLVDRVFTYQREAFQRYAGTIDRQSK
jgi:hypothetical protein